MVAIHDKVYTIGNACMASLGKGFPHRHINIYDYVIYYRKTLVNFFLYKILPNAILIGLKLIMGYQK